MNGRLAVCVPEVYFTPVAGFYTMTNAGNGMTISAQAVDVTYIDFHRSDSRGVAEDAAAGVGRLAESVSVITRRQHELRHGDGITHKLSPGLHLTVINQTK
jgi:hypothetical protein